MEELRRILSSNENWMIGAVIGAVISVCFFLYALSLGSGLLIFIALINAGVWAYAAIDAYNDYSTWKAIVLRFESDPALRARLELQQQIQRAGQVRPPQPQHAPTERLPEQSSHGTQITVAVISAVGAIVVALINAGG